MEMRASEDVELSRDLTSPLAPIAAALHPSSLPSRCPSCFRTLPPSSSSSPSHHPPPLRCCPAALRYCSPRCLSLDSPLHLSSAECRLLRLHTPPPPADLRLALRLLLSLRRAGVPFPRAPSRIAGLMCRGGGEGDMARKVREWGQWMLRARGSEVGNGGDVEIAVMWMVVLNAVEVVVDGRSPVGVAVYGPSFSWFNHSCAPNASYRFEIAGDTDGGEGSGGQVCPAAGGGDGEASDLLASWSGCGTKLKPELCRCGPRVIVRSIKPIKKLEELCIAYTDLLQPKAARQVDLWEKYHFVCCCQRCTASPEGFVDCMLTENTIPLYAKNSDVDGSFADESWEDISNDLEQAVDEYMLHGDAEICCEKIEALLCKRFQDKQHHFQIPTTNLKFQPMHHIALNAYMTLASAFKMQMNKVVSSSREFSSLEALKIARASAAYSLLLAGVTHYLFLLENSLIGTATLFMIDAGESLLVLANKPLESSASKFVDHSENNPLLRVSAPYTANNDSLVKQSELDATTACFLSCATRLSFEVWPILTAETQGLQNIKNPIDFSWLDKKYLSAKCLGGQPFPHGAIYHPKNGDYQCIGCKCTADRFFEGKNALYHLATHCLAYGGYLATICYSPCNSLVHHVNSLLQ